MKELLCPAEGFLHFAGAGGGTAEGRGRRQAAVGAAAVGDAARAGSVRGEFEHCSAGGSFRCARAGH